MDRGEDAELRFDETEGEGGAFMATRSSLDPLALVLSSRGWILEFEC